MHNFLYQKPLTLKIQKKLSQYGNKNGAKLDVQSVSYVSDSVHFALLCSLFFIIKLGYYYYPVRVFINV